MVAGRSAAPSSPCAAAASGFQSAASSRAAMARTAYSANPGRTSSFAVPIFCEEEVLGTLTLVFFAAAMTLDDAVARYLPQMKETAARIGTEMIGNLEN